MTEPRAAGDKGRHIKTQRVEDNLRLALYKTKAKLAGFVLGRKVDDDHEGKRPLFPANSQRGDPAQ